MKKIACVLMIFSTVLFARAQNVTVGPSAKPLRASIAKVGAEGSPYFNDNYSESTVKTKSNNELKVDKLKYNLLSQQLEYTDAKDVTYAIQDSVFSFSITDSAGMKHLFSKTENDTSKGYFELLLKDTTSLYRAATAKEELTEDFYTKKKVNKIVQQNNYFISSGKNFTKVNASKKGVLEAFPDKKNELKVFITQEQLDLKTAGDFILITKYYNTLNKKP